MARRSSSQATIDALRKDNARLQAEVARLSRVANDTRQRAEKVTNDKHAFLKKAVVVVSMVLAIILLVLGNLFFWAGNTLVKQDRFVAATNPIIQDSEVQHAMSVYATNKAFGAVDVQRFIEQVLPPRADFLAPQLASQLRTATQARLQGALATARLQTVWNDFVARQHERVMRYAQQYEGDGTVTLNEMYNQLVGSLSDTRLSFLADTQLPPGVGSTVLITAPWLPTLHTLITNIDVWRLLSMLGLIVCVGVAVWLSRDRRRAVSMLSLFGILGLLGGLLMVRATQRGFVAGVDAQYADGVERALDIVFSGYVTQTFTIIAALGVAAFIAWVSGGTQGAVAAKRHVGALFAGTLHNALFRQENDFTRWVSGHRRQLQWAAVVLFVAVMFIIRLSFTTLLVSGLALLAVVLGIELFSGRQTEHKEASD